MIHKRMHFPTHCFYRKKEEDSLGLGFEKLRTFVQTFSLTRERINRQEVIECFSDECDKKEMTRRETVTSNNTLMFYPAIDIYFLLFLQAVD
jgi:hypothetical protein